MYLLYLCIKKSQRSTIGDGSPLTVYLFPSQKVLPMYLLYLCKIQVSGRQPSAMVLRWLLIIPFSNVLPMYLLYLCKTQVSGRQPSTTALPPQSQLFPSQMYYPSTCTFCTCAKHKSAVFTAGVLAAFPPMALSCSPLSCLPASLPQSSGKPQGKPFTPFFLLRRPTHGWKLNNFEKRIQWTRRA